MKLHMRNTNYKVITMILKPTNQYGVYLSLFTTNKGYNMCGLTTQTTNWIIEHKERWKDK